MFLLMQKLRWALNAAAASPAKQVGDIFAASLLHRCQENENAMNTTPKT